MTWSGNSRADRADGLKQSLRRFTADKSRQMGAPLSLKAHVKLALARVERVGARICVMFDAPKA
jgi:hypothetical protein